MRGEFTELRSKYHKALLDSVLTINAEGIPSIADNSQKSSIAIAKGIVGRIGKARSAVKAAGQTSGHSFEALTCEFLEQAFGKLSHLRPGKWAFLHVRSRKAAPLSEMEQFSHLADLQHAVEEMPAIAAALGNDYSICKHAPDHARWEKTAGHQRSAT